MGKINLSANLISNEENLKINTTGIKIDNKIVYKENLITVTILTFNNKIEINRTCKDYKINLVLEQNKETISTYTLFEINKTLKLQTKCKKLKILDNEIYVEYELEENNFSYILKIGG